MEHKKLSSFPSDFLWGSASAAYQVEGAPFEDGKKASVWDNFVRIPGKTFKGTNGDVAVDHYHRYKEDVALMKELGLKSYRFSIAWTRILPDGRGEVNQAGLKFNEQNIFTSQGWSLATHPPGKRDMKLFYQVNHIANLANAAVINKFHELEMDGQIGPSFAYTPQYAKDSDPLNVLAAENAEELYSHFWMDVYLYGEYPIAAMAYLRENGLAPEFEAGDAELLKSAKPDFLGINYYQTATNAWNPIDGGVGVGSFNTSGKKGTTKESGIPGLHKKIQNPFIDRTNWDWEIDPEGLRIALRRITSRYRIPVMITENGLGEYDKVEEGKIHDDYRIKYLESHVKAIKEAMTDGATVIGYHTWSYTDLLSWLNGYQKRYGFVYVDQDETMEGSLKRIPKDSYYWYQHLIETNGEEL